MPRSIIPQYRKHKRGTAFVQHKSIGTSDHRLYLGKHGSEESIKRYRQFLEQLHLDPHLPTIHVGSSPQVCELVAAYLPRAKEHYTKEGRKVTYEYQLVKRALDEFMEMYGEELANSFGPKKLRRFRTRLIKRDLARRTVDHMVGRVKRFWQWACSEELCAPEIYYKLASVKGLRRGEEGVRETAKIKPAPLEAIEAVCDYVSPTVAAMLRVQFYCGMRPQDVTQMRMCDIDTSGKIWLYSPEEHKGKWRNATLIKAVPKAAQQIIKQFMRPDPTEYLFQPADSAAWAAEQRAKNRPPRKTKRYPCEVRQIATRRRNAQRRVKRKIPGTQYTTAAYQDALDYGFTKASKAKVKIQRFTPNQVRHSILTYVSQQIGQQAAQRWAGHENLATTDIYVEQQINELVDIAVQLDAKWRSA